MFHMKLQSSDSVEGLIEIFYHGKKSPWGKIPVGKSSHGDNIFFLHYSNDKWTS